MKGPEPGERSVTEEREQDWPLRDKMTERSGEAGKKRSPREHWRVRRAFGGGCCRKE